jgi:hypothetical protein
VANVAQKAIFLLHANPSVTPTKFCSAMKHYIKLSGNFSFKVIENVEFLVSPSSPTTFGLDNLAFTKPFPYAFLVEIICPIL